MSFSLMGSKYGKTRVRVAKVLKKTDRHVLHDMSVEVLLGGPAFDPSFIKGDNSVVVPTDTVKNTCYIVARNTDFESLEDYAISLGQWFVERHPEVVTTVDVSIVESIWTRIVVAGEEHNHAFVAVGPEERTVELHMNRETKALRLTSGVQNLRLLKTTQSGFEDFIKDENTTLPETKYVIRRMDTFAGPAKTGVYSPSVQLTEYEMALNIFKKHSEIMDIQLTMPNIHYIKFDLERFGLSNDNEILYPTVEPSGLIKLSIARPTSKL